MPGHEATQWVALLPDVLSNMQWFAEQIKRLRGLDQAVSVIRDSRICRNNRGSLRSQAQDVNKALI